jgi:Glycine zipper 2TM domain
MKTHSTRLLVLAAFASAALAASVPASAHDFGYGRHYGYARPHFFYGPRVVVRAPIYAPRPVVVYPAPAYYSPYYAPAYYAPAPAYPGLGAVGGAIVGGAIGSTIGHGNGRVAAIAAGSVLGAVAGSRIAAPY